MEPKIPTNLRSNHSPCRTSLRRMNELLVKPILLTATHQRTWGIVRYGMNVIGVPVEIGDGSVVLPGVKHDEIKQGSDWKTPPNAEVIVHLDLPWFINTILPKGTRTPTEWATIQNTLGLIASQFSGATTKPIRNLPAFIFRWSTLTPPSWTKEASVLLSSEEPSR